MLNLVNTSRSNSNDQRPGDPTPNTAPNTTPNSSTELPVNQAAASTSDTTPLNVPGTN